MISRRTVSRLLLATFLCCSSFPIATLHAESILPLDVQILTQEDFRARNYMSVAEAIRGRTSLKIEQDGYRGTRAIVKMRGLPNANQVLVLIDGLPMNHDFDGSVDVSQIPLEMVERIEITRGGASALYSAQAAAGVINIVTFRPERKGMVVDAATGVGRDGAKNIEGRFLARSNWGDMTYVPTNHSSGGYSQNEDYYATSHFANFTRSFSGKGFWGAEYFYNNSRIGLPNGTFVPFEQWNGYEEQKPTTPELQRTQEMQHVKAFAAYPLLAGGTTYISAGQSWRQSDKRQTRGGVSLLDKESRTSNADLSWQRKSVTLGVQARELKRAVFSNPDRKTYENSVYAAKHWETGYFGITPGIRFENESRTGGFLAPRVALTYSAEPEWAFSATAQRSHRIPSFDEYFSSTNVTSNGNLDDEKIWSWDLGTQWRPTSHLGFRINGFHSRVNDYISEDASAHFDNDGKAKTLGMETEIEWTNDPESEQRWESLVSWTLQESRVTLDSSPNWTSAPMTPRHQLKWSVNKHMKRKMVLTNELRYQSKQFELAGDHGVEVPDFLVWNARYALTILAADMYFAIDNITNVNYAETVATAPTTTGETTVLSPQPVRTYWVGVSIRFIN